MESFAASEFAPGAQTNHHGTGHSLYRTSEWTYGHVGAGDRSERGSAYRQRDPRPSLRLIQLNRKNISCERLEQELTATQLDSTHLLL